MKLKNKKVLVTGADGFIGSHLTEMLVQEGAKVKALSYYNSFNYWGWLEDINCLKQIEVISGDIRDPHFCREITKDIDTIFHLAALIAIPFSYKSPDLYVETNIKGTLNICQAALENKCERVIHTSTSEVYGTAQYVPIDEKHPKQPQSPYSASKIGADAIALSFFNAFDLPVTIARPFNTYGPRQSARAFIPTIITQILSGVSEIKVGDLTPTRDLNFVKDTCEGLLHLAQCNDSFGQEVNIASNYEISMYEVLELIKKILKSDVKFIIEKQRIRPANSEVFRLRGDNTKIQKLTEFKPKYSIEEGLKLTCDWFLKFENLKKYKAEIYNV